MPQIASPGIGSGLDVEGLVKKLVTAERAPAEKRLTQREARLQAELSAVGLVKGALSELQGKAQALAEAQTFLGLKATVSGEGVEATASAEAAPGSYAVTVSYLAEAHALASAPFASTTEVVGTGTLTIRFGKTVYDPATGTYSSFTQNGEAGTVSVAIDASNSTLAGIRDAINAASQEVQASIVNDGSGYRLVLRSARTGEQYAMEVSVTGDGDGNDADNAGLSRLAFNASAQNLVQTQAARDAQLSINGLAVTSPSNEVEGAIQGVTLSLRQATAAPVTVSVSRDRAAVEGAVQDFVKSFNGLVGTIQKLTSYDPKTRKAGPLLGDAAVRGIESRLRNLISSPVPGADGRYRALVDVGIKTQADGTLSVDQTVLDQALDQDPDAVAALFAAYGRPSDALVRFEQVGPNTQAGGYAVEVTALATRGRYDGAGVLPDFAAGGSVTIDATNDTLAVQVDGVASGTLQLTHGSYTSGEALAAELQARINGDAALQAAGVSVAVSYDAANARLVLESARYGSASTVEILSAGSATAATLGLSVGAGTAGTDVAGTIGGETATGSGQRLKAASGPAEGLELRILGGATGPRGTVQVTRGVGDLIQSLLEDGGLLNAREEGLQASIQDVQKDRERLAERLQALEARYRAQFTALDTLVAQMKTTSSYLEQQLAKLPG